MPEPAESPVSKYLQIVSLYDKEFKAWTARVVKLLKKYRDDNRGSGGEGSSSDTARFNILWANVQTLVPAVYSRMPKADVSRRFTDNDPVGRVAALLIERTLDYEIEHYPDFRSAMHNCVLDRFLGGRGVSWVRYEPHIKAQEVQLTEDVPDPDDRTSGDEPEPAEEIEYECTPTDYVYWNDFGHSVARTWEEVTAVWRWVYMTEAALKQRFPDKWKKIPLDSGPEDALSAYADRKERNDRAKICEFWNKETGTVCWFSKGMADIIEEIDDPLELEGFFPCPKPLYATLTTDKLVPVPDYALYQDQANELDILSDRIDGLVKALRVRGIYDASQPALQRLLTEGDNNTLIPTANWSAFSEKGGLKGSIDLIPVEIFSAALMNCYQARNDIKSQIYEITGISDIVRGQGAASETATAQQLKGQYAGLRLKSMQEVVAVFASELLRIKAQVICSKYQDQTILAYSAAQQLSEVDQQMIPAALQLLRQNPLNSFRIEVAADSLVQIDEQQTKQERLEFLGATSNFLREAVPAGQQVPELVPAIMGMIKFGISGFKGARQLEGVMDAALQQLEIKAQQAAANPQPDPEVQKEQAKAQAAMQGKQMDAQIEAQTMQVEAQRDAQLEQIRAQATAQMEQVRMFAQMQLQQQEQRHEAMMEQMRLQQEDSYKRWEAQLKAATAIDTALIGQGQNPVAASAAATGSLVQSLGGAAAPEPEMETIEQPTPPAAAKPAS